MTEYHRIFVNPDVVAVYKAIGDVILEMERGNAAARHARQPEPYTQSRVRMLRLAEEQRTKLNSLAKKTAVDATRTIKARLDATKVRTPTGNAPHLRSLIFCKPLIKDSGAVGVGDHTRLDLAINSLTPGYGPYWRAQEYGTGSKEVKSQVGRVIQGFFYGEGGSGKGDRPNSAYRGGGGPHPVFIPGSVQSGPRGGKGGKGTISVEIRPRYFLRDGGDEALVRWRQGMRQIEHDGSRDLAAALAAVRLSPTLRRR